MSIKNCSFFTGNIEDYLKNIKLKSMHSDAKPAVICQNFLKIPLKVCKSILMAYFWLLLFYLTKITNPTF